MNVYTNAWFALRGLLTTFAAVTLSLPAAAQSFDELAVRLLQHPAVSSIRLQSEAQQQMSGAAGALPDPVIRIGVNNVPISDPAFDRFLPSNKAIEFQQRIPNGKLRSALVTGAQASAQVSSLQAEYQLARLRSELITALAEKVRVKEQSSLARLRQDKLTELGVVIGSEIAAGRALAFRLPEVDIAKAEIAGELAELAGELGGLNARLISLVGVAADAAPPALAAANWTGDSQAFHEVRLAHAGIGIAEADVDRAQAGYRPEWGLSVMYQQRESGGDGARFAGDDWFSASVSFTVPLWGRKSQAPRVRAASARQLAARSSLDAAIRQAEARWAALNAAMVAAHESAATIQTTLAAIDAQQQALTSNYEGGMGDYPPVIEAQLAALTLRSQLAAQRSRAVSLQSQALSMLVSP